MTMRPMPARTKRCTCRSIKGCPCTRSSGFGVESVNGRMRSPRPAAMIIAACGRSLAMLRALLRGLELIVDAADDEFSKGCGLRVHQRRVAYIREYARQIPEILGLAVPIE